jgi:AraC family transcriptional regulator
VRDRSGVGFALIETAYPARSRLAIHTHDAAFACIVITGGFEETTPHTDGEVPAMTSLLRAPGERHTNRFGPTPSRCLNLTMDEGWLGEVGGPGVGDTGRRSLEDDAVIGGLRVYAALERAAPDDHLEDAVISWLSALGDRHDPRRQPSASLRRVREALDDADRPIRIRELAKLAECHPITLARRFRDCWGIGPAEYGRRVRHRKACVAVAGGHEPLARIAARFGFCDQSHLTRAMVGLLGLPPGTLRTGLQDG